MADQVFNSREINDLAQILTNNQHLLPLRERRLLLAIFAAAGDSVEVVPSGEAPATPEEPGPVELTAAELEDQLSASFSPGVVQFAAAGTKKHPLKIVGR